ncbi:uncharacterized protein LOC143214024 [Lasioglossum baleicum]|uniref:uncharacterized protein LOC143214024 n=1 Tax=Lasioglossum baleicum TaxID=434251 RepID=UPI003FCE5C81
MVIIESAPERNLNGARTQECARAKKSTMSRSGAARRWTTRRAKQHRRRIDNGVLGPYKGLSERDTLAYHAYIYPRSTVNLHTTWSGEIGRVSLGGRTFARIYLPRLRWIVIDDVVEKPRRGPGFRGSLSGDRLLDVHTV